MNDFSFNKSLSESDPYEINTELQLQLTNDEKMRLKDENTLLRNQFDQAINIRKELDRLHAENIQLMNKLKETELEKEDLGRKIHLNTVSFQEQIDKTKQDCSMKLNIAQQEIAHLRSQLNNQKPIHDVVDQKALEEKIKDALFKVDVETKKSQALQAKIRNIVDSCSTFLHISFPSPEAMLNYFNNASNSAIKSSPIIQKKIVKEDNRKEEELIIKKLSNKLIKEQSKRKKIQSELESSLMQVRSLQSEYDSQLNTAKREVKELKEKLERNDVFHAQIVQQLEHNIAKLREEIQRNHENSLHYFSNQQPKSNHLSKSQIYTDFKPNRDVEKLKSHFKSCVKKLHAKNEQLSNQIRNILQTKNDLEDEVKSLKEDISNLKSSIDTKTTELEMQIKQNEFLENERKAIQDELVKITTQIDREEKNRVSMLQTKIEEFEDQSEKLKKENNFISNQLKSQKSQISNLQKEIKDKRSEIFSLEGIVAELKEENSNLRDKVNSLDIRKSTEDAFPKSILQCLNAPPELLQQLNELYVNESLPLTTKVSTALTMIQSYYSKQIEQLQTALNHANESSEKKQSLIDNIFDQFALSNKNNMTNVIEEQDIVRAINELIKKIEKLKTEKDCYDKLMKVIAQKLSIPEDQISLNSICQIADQFNALKESFTKIKSDFKNVKKQKRLISEKSISEIETIQHLLNESQKQNKLLEVEINEKSQSMYDLEIKNQKLLLSVNEMEESLKNINQDHESYINQINIQRMKDIDNIKSNYNNEIISKDDQIQQMNEKIRSLEKSKEILKKGVSVLKKKLSQCADAINVLRKTNEDKEKQLTKKFETDKENIIKNNEDTILKLRDQCSNYRISLTKINKSLKNSELKNVKLVKEIGSLKRYKKKLEEQIDSLQEANERERKINETQLHAAILNAESKANASIANLKTTMQNEKQKILAYFAEQFRFFFDPSEQIDVDMYHRLVEKAKNELMKLHDSNDNIRRMTNASPGQTTEDAVAKFVYNHPNHCSNSMLLL